MSSRSVPTTVIMPVDAVHYLELSSRKISLSTVTVKIFEQKESNSAGEKPEPTQLFELNLRPEAQQQLREALRFLEA